MQRGVVSNALAHATDWFVTVVTLAGGTVERDSVDGHDLWPVLTTDTVEQAMERADEERGDKGADCADAAVEMVRLLAAIRAD